MTERDAVYLGALLHDVGKFYQRSIKDLRYSEHEILSSVFVNTLLDDELVNAIVALHHKADLEKSNITGVKRILAEIVCEADSIASTERTQQSDIAKQHPLQSIFSSVILDHSFEIKGYQPISSLTPQRYLFPTTNVIPDNELHSSYQKHWLKFMDESQYLNDEKPESLLHLYRKYLWCIPSSSYLTLPDVSLYEHSRLTAAVALCMHDYLKEQNDGLSKIKDVFNREEKRYILLTGDVTGIQNFIYNIGHKRALKALKGRSFFLNQLVTTVARHIVHSIDLSHANIIYASGGKFYLLLPNTLSTKVSLLKIQTEIEEKILTEYEGAIGMMFGSVLLSGNDFSSDAISMKWTAVSNECEKKKRRKFSTQFNQMFEPFGIGGNVVTCSATGKSLCSVLDIGQNGIPVESDYIKFDTSNGWIYRIPPDDENIDTENKYISSEQYQAQRIGEKLRNFSLLSIDNPDAKFSVLDIGTFDFPDEVSEENKTVLKVNDDDFIRMNTSGESGWMFYGGNWFLDYDFDELAEKACGLHRLGVLRMDVDNLGRIFKDGLGKKASFSRVVQLSSMLDFFFSSYLNKLHSLKWTVENGVTENGEVLLKDQIEIVYAGGDDLFIVGTWNVLPDVAIWIHDEFARFTCNNPNFTLSAGIAIFPKKFPLAKAAKLAGEAESKAKGERKTRNGTTVRKDAICFFDTVMKWSDFKDVRSKVNDIYSWVTQGKDTGSGTKLLNRAFIDRLQRIYSEFIIGKGKRWAPWRWRASYSLARFGQQYKSFSREISAFAAELYRGGNTEQDMISLLNVIATWSEHLTKEEKNANNV